MFDIYIITIFSNFIFLICYESISKNFNLYDNPDNNRKIHLKKISNIGGFLFLLNSLVIFIYYLLFYPQEISQNLLFFILSLSMMYFIVGFFDDKINLDPLLKLALSAGIYYLAIVYNDEFLLKSIYFNSLNITIFFGKYSVFVTLLCVLLLLNALNMFDGINLQSGLYLFSIFIVFIYKDINLIFSAMMVISLIFFIYLNFRNKLFLGNAGIWFSSFYISSSIITSYNQKLITVELVLILLLFPGIDMFRIFIERISSKNNPFKPDKSHIHHILLKSISSEKSAIIIFLCYLFPITIYFITLNFIISISSIIFFYFLILFKYKYFKSIK